MTQIDIALATYNGARFLEPLLGSFAGQTHKDLRVFASDDGSQDETVSILEAPGRPFAIHVVPHASRGNILRNFENAISATSAPYVALSDQDDFWVADKLESLLTRMQAMERTFGAATPLLVFSDLEIVSETLDTISPSYFASTTKSGKARQFKDFVLGNHVPGCAMLVNRALLDLALPYPELKIHDHWLIQIATLFGHVDCIDRPLIKYRQHASNTIGLGSAGLGGLARALAPLKAIRKSMGGRPALWRLQSGWIRGNMAALKARFGETIPSANDKALIDAILAGNVRSAHKLLAGAETGKRGIDYWGLLGTLAKLAKAT
ncbi:glycosyltransferase family 2 protein [Novosphingobium sp. 1949]|uniref:Glycosyltransferase family 2 protein n=1 Tax=Novosphingobium organovorum TaxID=2930092 RepID=A0ABT0BDR7_9SPHN|nr:glycosyltransferase family 2 protein [Novosphingobium organovorum]MCJ2183128.1 glycosyltransferase family 2 protein [Novosphingobium organovorum]